MKKYSFRLQTLLRVRELREEETERIFRGALVELTVAVESLEGMHAKMGRAVEDLNLLQKSGINLSVQVLYDQYFERMRERVRRQIEVIKVAEELVEERREELTEKIKERKTVEKLRMRDYDSYLQELRRFEQGLIDDLSTLRGGRKDLRFGITPL